MLVVLFHVQRIGIDPFPDADLPGYVFGETSFVPKELGRELKFTVTRGDYSPLMAQVVNELKSAEVLHI